MQTKRTLKVFSLEATHQLCTKNNHICSDRLEEYAIQFSHKEKNYFHLTYLTSTSVNYHLPEPPSTTTDLNH